jgi:hypothetical protein
VAAEPASPTDPRWSGTTPEQRQAAMAPVTDARTRAARRRHLDRVLGELESAQGPVITDEQAARLRALLERR